MRARFLRHTFFWFLACTLYHLVSFLSSYRGGYIWPGIAAFFVTPGALYAALLAPVVAVFSLLAWGTFSAGFKESLNGASPPTPPAALRKPRPVVRPSTPLVAPPFEDPAVQRFKRAFIVVFCVLYVTSACRALVGQRIGDAFSFGGLISAIAISACIAFFWMVCRESDGPPDKPFR